MKKVGLVLSLAVLALGFLVSPALAASPPQAARVLSAADQSFLASLAAPVGIPAPQPVAKRPGSLEKALCSATANCVGGGTISCTGNNSPSSCTAVDGSCPEPGHVTCDGVTSTCTNTCPPCNCAAERALCQSDCSPCPFIFSCNSTTCAVTCRCKFSGCPV